jgi:sensor histidine kinase YesM
MKTVMPDKQSNPSYPSLLWQFAVVLLFNTVIALTLSLMNDQGGFSVVIWPMMIYSHSIGLSIFTSTHLLWLRHRSDEIVALDIVIGIALGSVVGSFIGGSLTGTLDYLLSNSMSALGANVMLGLIFGSAIGHYFFSNYKMTGAKLELQQRENQQLTAQKELAETQLRLLQAQIEPHFLFNTLSNIHSLIETDPRRASTVLEAFSDYLRASLRRSRKGDTTLHDELDLINAYIEIQQARMGKRLRFKMEIPEQLLDLPCPPMLVQPLVENAVVHGIEPQVQGGVVELHATLSEQRLCISVNDDGAGFGGMKGGQGLALDNIRARLNALYGDTAKLQIHKRDSGGVEVVLQLPLEGKHDH